MDNIVQQIKDIYPDTVIHNLTEYLIDNSPCSCANQVYKLTSNDKNVIIIENVDYYKLYSLYNEFMRLKHQKAILQIHQFILSSMMVWRGSNALFVPKTVTNDILRQGIRSTLIPQLPCFHAVVYCKLELNDWTVTIVLPYIVNYVHQNVVPIPIGVKRVTII